MNNVVTVGISDANIVKGQDVLVSYGLGSCVGVCLYDTGIHLAGMVHILLPNKKDSTNQENIYKFADSGIHALLRKMITQGANRQRIIAKIAGGAEMFANQYHTIAIGKRNVEAVKETLNTLQIPICAEDTGSDYGRSIWFYANDGSLQVKTVKHGIQIL